MEDTDDRKWEILSTEQLIRLPWFTAQRDHVKLPTGVENPEFYVLEYPDWVNVIAITREGEFVMIRVERGTPEPVNMASGIIDAPKVEVPDFGKAANDPDDLPF